MVNNIELILVDLISRKLRCRVGLEIAERD